MLYVERLFVHLLQTDSVPCILRNGRECPSARLPPLARTVPVPDHLDDTDRSRDAVRSAMDLVRAALG